MMLNDIAAAANGDTDVFLNIQSWILMRPMIQLEIVVL
jgi:hypothetical protein